MGKWSDLPLELIECVEEYFDFLDKVRIRAVCRSWNSYLHNIPKLISEDLPWLLLQDSTTGASLYSVHEAKKYALNLPEFKHKVFKGSSYGWIVTLDDENSSDIDGMYAVNPLTRSVVKLPPRSSFPDVQDFNPLRVGREYIMRDRDEQDPMPEPEPPLEEREPEPPREECEPEPREDPLPGHNYAGCRLNFASKKRVSYTLMRKVVLSSSPRNDDCMAVAIYGECLWAAWCRPHHKQWSSFKKYNGSGRTVMDVVFNNGKLYVLYTIGRLEIYDSIDPQEILRQVVPPQYEDPPTKVFCIPMYLAVCPDFGIIIATRCHEDRYEDGVLVVETEWIYLYKLAEKSETWVDVKGVSQNILFIGLNMSSLIPVSDDFKALGYKRNCIYYTDHFAFLFGRDETQNDSDMGLFDLNDSYTHPLPGFKVEPEFFWPPPIWVTPSAN